MPLTNAQAITQLSHSPRGRKALAHVTALLRDGGLYLDLANLSALEALFANAKATTTANVLQDIEASPCPKYAFNV